MKKENKLNVLDLMQVKGGAKDVYCQHASSGVICSTSAVTDNKAER